MQPSGQEEKDAIPNFLGFLLIESKTNSAGPQFGMHKRTDLVEPWTTLVGRVSLRNEPAKLLRRRCPCAAYAGREVTGDSFYYLTEKRAASRASAENAFF